MMVETRKIQWGNVKRWLVDWKRAAMNQSFTLSLASQHLRSNPLLEPHILTKLFDSWAGGLFECSCCARVQEGWWVFGSRDARGWSTCTLDSIHVSSSTWALLGRHLFTPVLLSHSQQISRFVDNKKSLCNLSLDCP